MGDSTKSDRARLLLQGQLWGPHSRVWGEGPGEADSIPHPPPHSPRPRAGLGMCTPPSSGSAQAPKLFSPIFISLCVCVGGDLHGGEDGAARRQGEGSLRGSVSIRTRPPPSRVGTAIPVGGSQSASSGPCRRHWTQGIHPRQDAPFMDSLGIPTPSGHWRAAAWSLVSGGLWRRGSPLPV